MISTLTQYESIFEPILPYINLIWHKPIHGTVKVNIVLPQGFIIDTEMLKTYFDKPNVKFIRYCGGVLTEIEGVVKDESLSNYILTNYYENRLGK